jgi:dipeptidyl aminopeptidase/acylaminoacyl peptidase
MVAVVSVVIVSALVVACSPADDSPAIVAPQPTTVIENTSVENVTQSEEPVVEFVPTAIPDGPLHPLSIDLLRARDYPGSDFVFEQTLAPGVNYSRYVVSYLSDGLKIYAMLTIPNEPRPPTGYPVVIFNHGYITPSVYRTTERYVAYVDAFARNGYIVVKSDYRGHGFSEGTADGAYGDPGYVIDVLNALGSARRYPDADPNRIGKWGHSMGGYITLRAMVVAPDIRAGVIWAGVVASYDDLFARWFRRGSSNRGWRAEAVTEYGTPQENPGFWASLSANSYLRDLSGPVQIHHGTGDTTVPVEYSITLEEQIRAVNEPVELILYQNDDHNIAVNRENALITSVVFFDRYVKGIGG